MPTKFWVEDPCILLTDIKFFPTQEMTKDEKLNALTRLSLVVGGGLYFAKYEYWFTFIILALLMILILKYATAKEGFAVASPSVGSTPVDAGSETSIENFTLVPTFPNPNMHQTTVSPLFSEEWQVYPPVYDLYTNTGAANVTYQEPLMPQSYPYGQYLTTTNLLPNDEQGARLLNGGPRQAREYVNSAWTRNTLAHRDNMTRLYKLRLARRFRHNVTDDSFSPYSSY